MSKYALHRTRKGFALHLSCLLFAATLLDVCLTPRYAGATFIYDVTITDGTRVERHGNPVTPPLSFDATFPDTPPPFSDAMLEIVASGDFDGSNEFLHVYAEGSFLGDYFIDAGLEVVTTENVSIPQSLLSTLTSDGMVEIYLEGTSGGPNNVNILTVESVRLSYTAVPDASTMLLIGTSLVGLVGFGRKSRR